MDNLEELRTLSLEEWNLGYILLNNLLETEGKSNGSSLVMLTANSSTPKQQ
jgi:hypothetical protein